MRRATAKARSNLPVFASPPALVLISRLVDAPSSQAAHRKELYRESLMWDAAPAGRVARRVVEAVDRANGGHAAVEDPQITPGGEHL